MSLNTALLALVALAGTTATRPAGPASFAEALAGFLQAGRTFAVVARADLGAGTMEVDGGEWRFVEGAPPPEGRLEKGTILRVRAVRLDGIRLEVDVAGAGGRPAAALRFVLPFAEGDRLTARDAAVARRYVERYLRLAPDEAAARRIAARLGGVPAANQSSK